MTFETYTSHTLLFAVITMPVSTYTNPVVNSNHPDPAVLALPDNQGYVAVSTSDLVRPNSDDPVFPILYSIDLVHWTLVSNIQ